MPADILRRFGQLIIQETFFKGLFDMHLYGFKIVKVGWNDKISVLLMDYKNETFKTWKSWLVMQKVYTHRFSGKYTIKFALAGWNKKIIINE